ncbi:hypothetical protein PO909_002589 [Leuciscus waleckii]
MPERLEDLAVSIPRRVFGGQRLENTSLLRSESVSCRNTETRETVERETDISALVGFGRSGVLICVFCSLSLWVCCAVESVVPVGSFSSVDDEHPQFSSSSSFPTLDVCEGFAGVFWKKRPKCHDCAEANSVVVMSSHPVLDLQTALTTDICVYVTPAVSDVSFLAIFGLY